MDLKTALNKAASLCSKKEYCRSDIRKKLYNWNIPPADWDKVIEQLATEKFIDESRFATFYVRDKFRFNRWGRKKIWWKLKEKDVPEEIISEALAHVDQKDYLQMLKDIVSEKYRQIKKCDLQQQKAALIRNAVSKGYEYHEIVPIVEQILLKNK
jgi:regulatory protein